MATRALSLFGPAVLACACSFPTLRYDDGSGGGGDPSCIEPGPGPVPVTCDVDRDGALSRVCCGDDCDDGDADVFPGQIAAFAVPRLSGGFDYDCDGEESPDEAQLFGELVCGEGLGACLELPAKQGYGSRAQCGRNEDYFICQADLGQVCTPHETQGAQGLRCR